VTSGIASTRRRPLARSLCTSAAALLFGGCVSYSPAQLAAMATLDICDMTHVQSYNLTPETQSAVQSELSRRNESCTKYASAVAQRRQDFLDRETYGNQSP
jgi:hypothetical protein